MVDLVTQWQQYVQRVQQAVPLAMPDLSDYDEIFGPLRANA